MPTAPYAPNAKAGVLRRESTALLMIDLQYTLLAAMFEPERVLANCTLLLHLAELLRLPVILTTQYEAGLGHVHPEISRLVTAPRPYDKSSFSCFGDPNFAHHLMTHAPGANTLLLAGIESHICVMQTALGAIAAGYLVHVAADAVSSRTVSNWQLGVERMSQGGAAISSAEMAAYELLGRAGTPEFRAMHPHLK
ncbi:MAG TPA: isochorismatase family protein [Terriglobia bacterium]|nr:isochorismatase family protein [Terriglobia bacterium]